MNTCPISSMCLFDSTCSSCVTLLISPRVVIDNLLKGRKWISNLISWARFFSPLCTFFPCKMKSKVSKSLLCLRDDSLHDLGPTPPPHPSMHIRCLRLAFTFSRRDTSFLTFGCKLKGKRKRLLITKWQLKSRKDCDLSLHSLWNLWRRWFGISVIESSYKPSQKTQHWKEWDTWWGDRWWKGRERDDSLITKVIWEMEREISQDEKSRCSNGGWWERLSAWQRFYQVVIFNC